MRTANRLPAPAPDELEISLFGPGIGECVVLHVGDGQWITVDSCLDRTSRQPVALDYLKELGVDVAKAVRLVAVTHWHDDHIKGVAAVVRAASSAEVSCSSTLRGPEFRQFIAASAVAMDSPGGSELSQIARTLMERKKPGTQPTTVAPVWAHADRRLFQRPAGPGGFDAEVWSLSPSDGTLALAFQEIAALLLAPGQTQRRAVALTPNRASVVLWVVAGNVRVLLGGDLEEGGGPALGWRAILASTARPPGRASVFKVAHHGSINAHHDGIWTDLLTETPIAVLTPFTAGHQPLPTAGDVARITARAAEAYCTARPGAWSPPRRHNAVERTVRETARARRVLRGPAGRIRLRTEPATTSPTWRVDLFGEAVQL